MKKRRIKFIGMVALLFLCMIGMSGTGAYVAAQEESAAEDKVYGDFSYKVLSDGNVSITKYNGSASEVRVPETIEGRNVTEIGEHAFSYNSTLVSVYLPKTLKVIGSFSFWGCHNLEYIKMCEGIEEIGRVAFVNCKFRTITIPNSVKIIRHYAFLNNHYLKEIRLPEKLTEIEEGTFRGCDHLESIYIPKSVKVIGVLVFQDCHTLKSIKSENVYYSGDEYIFIPSTIEEVESACFQNCYSIKNIVFLGKDTGVDYIENSATLYGYKESILSEYAEQMNKTFVEFVPVKDIVLNATHLEIQMDKTNKARLTATCSPSNCTVNQIYWTSSNEEVAKVDQEGNITTLSWGNAVITARSVEGSNVVKTCNVRVNTKVTSLKLNKTKTCLSLDHGKTATLSAKLFPANATDKKLNWKTSNGKVVSVNSKGKITAKGPGVAKVTASIDGVSASCEVTVAPAAVKKLKAAKNATNAISLTWEKSTGATGYRIYRYDGPSKKYIKLKDTKLTTYKVTKLQSATGYIFKVMPYKIINGKKKYGQGTSIKTATSPEKTEIVSLKTLKSSGKRKIRITWKKVSRASGYMVYRSTKKSTGYKCIATISGKSKTTYVSDGVTSKKTYYFKVVAYKKIGNLIIKGGYSSRRSI